LTDFDLSKVTNQLGRAHHPLPFDIVSIPPSNCHVGCRYFANLFRVSLIGRSIFSYAQRASRALTPKSLTPKNRYKYSLKYIGIRQPMLSSRAGDQTRSKLKSSQNLVFDLFTGPGLALAVSGYSVSKTTRTYPGLQLFGKRLQAGLKILFRYARRPTAWHKPPLHSNA